MHTLGRRPVSSLVLITALAAMLVAAKPPSAAAQNRLGGHVGSSWRS